MCENSEEKLTWLSGYRYLQIAVFLCLCIMPLQLHAATPSKMTVFVSIAPLQWLCEQLAGDELDIHLLLAKGQEPHAFEPSPKQIRALSHARLFFTVGLPFEQEMSRRFTDGGLALQIVDTSVGINKIPITGEAHGHGHEVLDPHVWLSPLNVEQMAIRMTAGLIAADPDRALFYGENLEQMKIRLDSLDRDISKRLAPYTGSTFFVFHPAFGYFADRYHLHQVAVETGGKSPTPKQLFGLIKKAKADGIKVLFVQPQFDPRSAESVARAIDGMVVPLDPLAGNSIESMTIMAEKIYASLAGSGE